MKKTAFYILTIWLVLWIQLLSNHFIGGSGWAADVVLVAVLFVGLSRGPFLGELMGFAWGLLVDAASLGLLGLHGILYAGAGYLAGILCRQLDGSKLWTQSVFSLGVSLVYVALYQGLDRFFSPGVRPIAWGVLIQPLSNAILAPFIFWLLQQWTQMWAIFPERD